jgi:hypothetical protein
MKAIPQVVGSFSSRIVLGLISTSLALAITGFAADLTVEKIKTDPELWPNQVKVSETLNYGAAGKVMAGTVVDFIGFTGPKEISFQYRNQTYRLEPELTDLVNRAERISSGAAKADGWNGRVADYLTRKAKKIGTSGSLEGLAANAIDEKDIFVVYYGSSGCSYCSSALPFMNHTLDLLEQRYPGKIHRVYSTGDDDSAASRRYAQSLGAGWIVAPLGDRYLWQGLEKFAPGADKGLNYPAVAIITSKGKMLAGGMRQETKTDSVDAAVRQLETILSKPGV